MSTRFYPRYVKGNPQLRIFLPDWKMIMIKPKNPHPENIVSFKIDIKMTDWDVKNYLEKIYKVKVGGVTSKPVSGDLVKLRDGFTKREDYRIAQVFLPVGQTFSWPDLFPRSKLKSQDEDLEKTKQTLSAGRARDKNVQDVPSWFL